MNMKTVCFSFIALIFILQTCPCVFIFNILGQTLGPLVGGWTEKTEKVEIGQRVHKQICHLCTFVNCPWDSMKYPLSLLAIFIIITLKTIIIHFMFSSSKKLCIKVQGVFLTGTPPKSSKYKKVNLG